MTLRTNATRPGQRWLALVVGVVALMLGAAAVALALIEDSGTFNVEVADSSESSDLIRLGDVGSGYVKYIGSDADDQASGTGLFDPFVRLQASPTENGYNTDGAVQFDTKVGKWTHAIKASAIPIVDCETDGDPLTTEKCWELLVDINDSNNAKYVSLTMVQVWFANSATLVGYNETTHTFASGATLQYEFTGEIQIHDVNQGSGRGDLLYLVPVVSFTANDWFVLYSEWGSTTAAPDGKTYGSDGGFEEWKVRKTPNLSITKTADAASVNAGSPIGFTITVTNGGVADATGVTITDELPGGAGIDWSEDSANCAITGSPAAPPEILTCGPVTLAAGGGSLSVHVTSATTAASCGTYDNTATFTSTNAGTGSDDASVIVNCAAIQILKQSTKTSNPLVTQAGAVFSVTGPGSYSASVTDNGTGDEDSTIGEVCISGLQPGAYTVNETTPPAGYGGASEVNLSATAAQGTNCGLNPPTLANSAVFTNAPLADLLVRVDGQESTEIASSISCVDGGNTSIGSVGIPTPVDPAELDVNDLEPDTYVCTIVIDP